MGKDFCVICGVTLKQTFKFPKRSFSQWAALTCVSKERLRKFKPKSFKVCEDHFHPEDIFMTTYQTRIRSGSVPSLRLPIPKEDQLPKNDFLFQDPPKTIFDPLFEGVSPVKRNVKRSEPQKNRSEENSEPALPGSASEEVFSVRKTYQPPKSRKNRIEESPQPDVSNSSLELAAPVNKTSQTSGSPNYSSCLNYSSFLDSFLEDRVNCLPDGPVVKIPPAEDLGVQKLIEEDLIFDF